MPRRKKVKRPKLGKKPSRRLLRTVKEIHNEEKVQSALDDFGRTPKYYEHLFATIKEHMPLKRSNIVQIGASSGIFTSMLQREGVRAYAYDKSKKAGKYSKRTGNRRIITGKSARMPFGRERFDAVVSDHFLISGYPGIQPKRTWKEIYRILKPQGFVFLERVSEADWEKLQGDRILAGFDILKVEHSYAEGIFYEDFLRVVLRKKLVV